MLGILFYLFHHKSLTEPGAHHCVCVGWRGGENEAGWSVSSNDPPAPPCAMLGFTACVVMPSFYVGTEDLNPGPRVYTASTITH